MIELGLTTVLMMASVVTVVLEGGSGEADSGGAGSNAINGERLWL